MRFSVVLHSDDGVRFGVNAPDLPGCFSSGDTFDVALDSVLAAIDLHLEGMVEDGEALPIPQAIVTHQANPDFAGGVWAVVDADTLRFEGKAEKINITMPKLLIARIDNYAKAHGISRSGFLAQAAQQAMRQ
jgi:predicted RNase H-like HicB family nuclease